MKFKFLAVIPLVLGLGACSSTIQPEVDYRKDYAFENIKSFAILADEERPMDVVYQISDITNDRIAKAIELSLLNKGLKLKGENEADILVSYQVVTKDKTRIRSYGTTAGYRCYRCRGVGHIGVGTNVDVRNYTEGTVIIDMLDPETKKSVWRSIVSKPVKSSQSVSAKTEEIQQGIETMLENFLVIPAQ